MASAWGSAWGRAWGNSWGTVGAISISVPSVTGLDLYAATTAIYAAGLTLTTVSYAYSSLVAQGKVISQTPVAGVTAAFGAAVQLVVSLGAQVSALTVTVPNVIGLDEWVARYQCTLAKLILNTTQYAYNAATTQAQVVSQSLAAGSIVPQWTPITLTVSSGYP